MFCRRTEDGRLEPSSGGWQNSGMGGRTESLTLSTCEWTASSALFPSDDVVCSLSDILVTHGVPLQYFLSERACAGILRRAEKRGKSLPPLLREALLAIAPNWQSMELSPEELEDPESEEETSPEA